ncbi:hypothetical protein VNO78_16336 [Psophocarpus tetragonolobus]|uniref:Uncharacterized protein n=1 Tax=Psophocarpus tetragonolobus TaxID=3891 RepID=A0AAN9SGN2_PSOTE
MLNSSSATTDLSKKNDAFKSSKKFSNANENMTYILLDPGSFLCMLSQRSVFAIYSLFTFIALAGLPYDIDFFHQHLLASISIPSVEVSLLNTFELHNCELLDQRDWHMWKNEEKKLCYQSIWTIQTRFQPLDSWTSNMTLLKPWILTFVLFKPVNGPRTELLVPILKVFLSSDSFLRGSRAPKLIDFDFAKPSLAFTVVDTDPISAFAGCQQFFDWGLHHDVCFFACHFPAILQSADFKHFHISSPCKECMHHLCQCLTDASNNSAFIVHSSHLHPLFIGLNLPFRLLLIAPFPHPFSNKPCFLTWSFGSWGTLVLDQGDNTSPGIDQVHWNFLGAYLRHILARP